MVLTRPIQAVVVVVQQVAVVPEGARRQGVAQAARAAALVVRQQMGRLVLAMVDLAVLVVRQPERRLTVELLARPGLVVGLVEVVPLVWLLRGGMVALTSLIRRPVQGLVALRLRTPAVTAAAVRQV